MSCIPTDTAIDIVDAIVYDLRDRKGLGDVWDEIDEDIQQRIRTEWITMIHKKLADHNRYIQDLRQKFGMN